jgi:prolyl-tRNA synthetase
MRVSALLAPTLREDPTDAEVVSHKLMLRAGMIRKLAAGVYELLPLGLKVIQNISNIIREEMNRAGGQEVLLPALLPAELWQETGRWDIYGKELMRIKDRHDREFCLGPTHEEAITDLVRKEVRSYKQLPLNLYQIQTKFRDEIRPRFGLMRGREFLMKDAYSFDRDETGLEVTYKKMDKVYRRIFDRCGLKYKVVEADPGPIGGGFSQEFMVLSDTGEDEIVHCEKCDYAASHEMTRIKGQAPSPKHQDPGKTHVPKVEKIKTPNVKTIEQLSEFLKVKPARMIKTLIHELDGKAIAVLIRGDHALNESRLKKLLGTQNIKLAEPDFIRKVTGAPVGFSGPVGLKNVRIIADRSVLDIEDGVTGANEADAHIVHVQYGRDYKADIFEDLRLAEAGDPCPVCEGGKLIMNRGIEVGHIFKLGTKYSAKMNANFLDEDGKEKPFIMGCYGIGVGRTAAAAIEQRNDKDGIIWPLSLAPFKAVVVPVNVSEKDQEREAIGLYEKLIGMGLDVLLDDRNERVGVRLKDIDLIGIPIKVIIGPKGLAEGKVEIKLRTSSESKFVKIDDAVNEVAEKIKELLG